MKRHPVDYRNNDFFLCSPVYIWYLFYIPLEMSSWDTLFPPMTSTDSFCLLSFSTRLFLLAITTNSHQKINGLVIRKRRIANKALPRLRPMFDVLTRKSKVLLVEPAMKIAAVFSPNSKELNETRRRGSRMYPSCSHFSCSRFCSTFIPSHKSWETFNFRLINRHISQSGCS